MYPCTLFPKKSDNEEDDQSIQIAISVLQVVFFYNECSVYVSVQCVIMVLCSEKKVKCNIGEFSEPS